MAFKVLVLINNTVLEYENEPVLMKKMSNQTIFMTRTHSDCTEFVVSVMSDIVESELTDELYSIIIERKVKQIRNDALRIVAFETPLYSRKVSIASTEQSNLVYRTISGELENITDKWNSRIKLKFIADEVVKFSELIKHITYIINNGLKYSKDSPAFRLVHDGNPILNLIGVNARGIVNPFHFTPHAHKTKMFRQLYKGEFVEQISSYDEPRMFTTELHKGSVKVLAGTSSDILKLCNIELDLILKVSDLIKLVGALVLEDLGVTTENLELPVRGVTMFRVDGVDAYEKNILRGIFETFELAEEAKHSGDSVSEFSILDFFLMRASSGSTNYRSYLSKFEEARLVE